MKSTCVSTSQRIRPAIGSLLLTLGDRHTGMPARGAAARRETHRRELVASQTGVGTSGTSSSTRPFKRTERPPAPSGSQ